MITLFKLKLCKSHFYSISKYTCSGNDNFKIDYSLFLFLAPVFVLFFFVYRQENKRLKELIEIRNKESNSSESSSNAASRLSNIPEPTEFEYLKNIIFEYMMGREPLVSTLIFNTVLILFNFCVISFDTDTGKGYFCSTSIHQ